MSFRGVHAILRGVWGKGVIPFLLNGDVNLTEAWFIIWLGHYALWLWSTCSILSAGDIQSAALAFVILMKELCQEYFSAGTHTQQWLLTWPCSHWSRGWWDPSLYSGRGGGGKKEAISEGWWRAIPDATCLPYPAFKTGSLHPSVHQGVWHSWAIIPLAFMKEDIISRV